MSTATMGRTSVLEVTDTDPTTGKPRLSHLIAPKDGIPGHTLAFEARMNGTPVEALCGHVLVPTRNPEKYPTCQQCQAIFKENTGHDDGYKAG